jgi:hypothetical protein
MTGLNQHKAFVAQLPLSLLLDDLDVVTVFWVNIVYPSMLAEDRWCCLVAHPFDLDLAAIAHP